MSKVCFVISPIGDEGSATRVAADDLYDIVISPVLRTHGFDVVRADKIASSGTIGDEVVDLIQNATLCVIDLTGHNANVYYECGRRHETGKPFIQLMKKGEKLPFDLAGIRTIFYDLSTARLAHAASQEIDRLVKEFERSGFTNESAGISLGSLAIAVDRIDRKLDTLRDAAPSITRAGIRNQVPGGIEALLISPRTALFDAVRAGDLDAILALYPRIRQLGVESDDFAISANILASNGIPEGLAGLEEIIRSDNTAAQWPTATAGITQYASLRRLSGEVFAKLEDVIASRLDSGALPETTDRAFMANQLSMFAHNAKEYQKAANYARRAIDLNPSELAFKVNLAMALRMSDIAEAVKVVDAYMEIDEALTDDYALDEAFDVYLKAKQREDAERVLQLLDQVDPQAAALKRLNLN